MPRSEMECLFGISSALSAMERGVCNILNAIFLRKIDQSTVKSCVSLKGIAGNDFKEKISYSLKKTSTRLFLT